MLLTVTTREPGTGRRQSIRRLVSAKSPTGSPPVPPCKTQLTAQNAAVQQAEWRLTLARRAYQAGVTSRLELLDAQPITDSTRQAMLGVRHAELTSAIALYRAPGGGP